jgi:hypothetical protein
VGCVVGCPNNFGQLQVEQNFIESFEGLSGRERERRKIEH